jgi:hypothetical protein
MHNVSYWASRSAWQTREAVTLAAPRSKMAALLLLLVVGNPSVIEIGGWLQSNRSVPSRHAWVGARQCGVGAQQEVYSRQKRVAAVSNVSRATGARPFTFTPVRTWRADGQPGATVIPLILVGMEKSRHWSKPPSPLHSTAALTEWHRHLLSPFSITLLVMLAKGYTVKGKAGAHALARKVGLRRVNCEGADAVGCAALRALDEGYVLYSFDDDPTDALLPSYVLLGVLTVPEPQFVSDMGVAERAGHS